MHVLTRMCTFVGLRPKSHELAHLYFNPENVTYNLQQTTISNFAAFSNNEKGIIFRENRGWKSGFTEIWQCSP